MSNVERGPLPLLLPRRRELPSPRLYDAPGFIYSAELELLYQLIRQLPTESTKIFTGDKYLGAAMLAVVFSLYCPLINRTVLKVVFMFVKDTIWSLFFIKSPETAWIHPKNSQNQTHKWRNFSTSLLNSKSDHRKMLDVDDRSDTSI